MTKKGSGVGRTTDIAGSWLAVAAVTAPLLVLVIAIAAATLWDVPAKGGIEIAKGIAEFLAFFAALVYFVIRLLAGEFIFGRLESELTAETPFADKELVRATVKLKNPGQATHRVTDARLWVFLLDADGAAPEWRASGSDGLLQVPARLHERRLDALDFTRVSVVGEKLQARQSFEGTPWLNIEPGGSQRREFLFRLAPGLYKLEFRLVSFARFAGRAGLIRMLGPLQSLGRGAQWVATAVVQVPPIAIQARIGILAYGSLIDDPGDEIAAATESVDGAVTPFAVEFARSSSTRGGAPTLIPVPHGGAPVRARIFVLRADVTEAAAKDMLWRRETRQVGRYDPPEHPGANTVMVKARHDQGGLRTILHTEIAANITPLTAEALAQRAYDSANDPALLRDGRDGVSYLIDAKRNGITTPLLAAYEDAVIRLVDGAQSLEDARERLRARVLGG